MTSTNKVFSGAIITVAMRWSDRLIGLVSTIVLARLLVPEDFGIVAMSMLMVGFVDVFLNLGVNQVLIHNKNAQRADYDTAWTVRLIQAGVVSLLIGLTAPLAATYFNTPDVTDVLRVIAISILIGGFENIGIITFQKEMKFGRDFKLFFIKRIIGFLVTLAIALVFQSYWAMVLGSVAFRIAGVLLSYGMHPYRPRLSLSHLKPIWSFSQWVLFKNIGSYFDASIDRILIGRQLDAGDLGGYTLASEIASMPTTEMLAPIGRVLFPAFVDKRDDPIALANRVTLAIGVQGLVALPACIGIAFVSQDLVNVALGENWSFIAPLIQIMAVGNLVVALAHSLGYALLALGKVKIQAIVAWLQASLFVCVALAFGENATAESFAIMRVIVISFGSLILISIVLLQIKVLSLKAFVGSFLRPVIGTAIMTGTLLAIHPLLQTFSELMRLLLEISVGGLVYPTAIALMWLAAGRPEGAEFYIVSNIRHKFE